VKLGLAITVGTAIPVGPSPTSTNSKYEDGER